MNKITDVEFLQTPSYNIAFGTMTLCVVAYYFGTRLRKVMPDYILTFDAVESIRFATFPLMIVTSLVLGMVTMSVREGFDKRQQRISEIANYTVNIDRALIHLGTPESIKLHYTFIEDVKGMIDFKHGIISVANNMRVWHDFLDNVQAIPVPKGDTGIAANTKLFLLRHMGLWFDSVGLNNVQSQYMVYPFTMIMLTIWLLMMFVALGMIAPLDNAASFWYSVIVAACVGSIFFVIVEYESPFVGFLHLDMTPMKIALEKMDRGMDGVAGRKVTPLNVR